MPRPISPFRADQREGTADHGIAASEARDARAQQFVGPLLGRLDALERRVADSKAGGTPAASWTPARRAQDRRDRWTPPNLGPPPPIGPPAWRRPPATSPVPPRWRFWERR